MLRASIALFALFALAACAGTPQLDRLNTAPPDALPVRAELTNVPFYAQEDLYCGPAALAMALSWSGEPVTQDVIAPQVYTPGREGTLRSDMVGAARRNGRLAVPVNNLADLLGEIAAGHPVIVFQNLGLSSFTQWHYAVAIGYDLDTQRIVLHSGTQERRSTRLSTFERTWQRGDFWALVVLPPDRLPATARLEPVLGAAAGLERAGRNEAAETAYRTIAEHWTSDDAALIGLANVLYGRKKSAAAEQALRAAVRRNPRSAPAWNNLAVVLGESGQTVAALAAVRRAIEIDGGATPAYRETLAELQAGS
jgi:tetratricopeptide (TPR) repeat protein